MATPGWYPDPAGRPGAFRYWDGQDWGADTSDQPPSGPQVSRFDEPTNPPGSESGAPATAPMPAFQSYERPYAPVSYPPQPYAAQPPSGGSGRTVVLVVVAVLVTLALGVATFFVVRPLLEDDEDGSAVSDRSTSEPTDAPTDAAPREAPTDGPTDAPTEGSGGDPFTDDRTPTAQVCEGGAPGEGATPIADGRQRGGGLSMPEPEGFSDTGPLDQSGAFVFATGVSAPSQVVVDGWVAVHALGALPRDNGFGSTEQAALDVLECMTLSPSFYRSFSGAEVLGSQAVEVDGNPGWVVDAEIRVDDPAMGVEGDVAKVVVVDTGDLDSYGVLVSLVAIGRQDLIDQQQGLLEVLTTD